MPWQRQTANVAYEITDTGEWAYPTVIIIVQRQAGKTSLVDGSSVHRAITGEDRGVWYTAQTRQDARDEWLKLVKRLRRSPLKPPLIKIRESNGSETITFPTGSEYRPFAPSDDALHGKATHLVTVDEAWAFTDEQGDALLQAIVPTFTTTPGQLLIPSAAGNAKSTWLQGLAETGRMFVEANRRDTIAYFEWGIGDDVDPLDLGAVALAHPGYGYTLRPQALVNAASTMKPAEFARAYGSRWGGAAARVIPAPLWEAARDAGTPLPAGPYRWALAFDVDIDDANAAICLAWRDSAGVAHVEVADARDGAAWLIGRLGQLGRDHKPLATVYDHYGPAVAAAEAGRRAGLILTSTTTDEYVTACAAFLSGLVDGSIKVRPHPALDDAAAAALRRPVGERWAWGRRKATSSIAPLVAATLAIWAFDHAPPPFRIR